MKIIKWFIVAGAALSVGYLFNHFALDSDLNFTKSVYQKKIAIVRKFAGQKRIIVIGGSGTHYGIDAFKIERELNMPSINVGLHGGLGLNAILGSVKNDISAGDIVILIPEYGILSDDGTGWLSAYFGSAINRPGLGGSGLRQKAAEAFKGCTLNLTSFGKSLMRILFGAKGRAFDGVGERGDAIVYLPGTAVPFKIDYIVSDNAKASLSAFNRELSHKGATFLIGLPWVLVYDDDKKARKTVSKIAGELNQIAPVLYNEDTFNLYTDPRLFSDTGLHNTKDSRELRSVELAKQIRKALSAKSVRTQP